MNNTRVCAILLAAGSGSRMNIGVAKQRLSLKGKSILSRSLEAFQNCESITDMILVIKREDTEFATAETEGRFSKLSKIVIGGNTRTESAKCGFYAIDFPCDYVSVHDVARCLVTPDMITKVVNDAILYGAATASSRVVDTVKKVDTNGFSVSTENREILRLASTPQIFKYEFYEKAMSDADTSDLSITDDNMLMERMGIPVYMTDVGATNIKITYSDDILFAEYLLEKSDG